MKAATNVWREGSFSAPSSHNDADRFYGYGIVGRQAISWVVNQWMNG